MNQTDEAGVDHLRKYGAADFSPDVRKDKSDNLGFTPAELAQMRRFEAMRADAPYLGWPKPPPQPEPLQTVIAKAFRAKAAAKRVQAASGTSRPDGFPDVVIRSPDAVIALELAEMFEELADDCERV
jgi:hypothetical protein